MTALPTRRSFRAASPNQPYVQHINALADGRVVTEGVPADVVTPELVEKIFGLRCVVIPDPAAGTPLVTPADD